MIPGRFIAVVGPSGVGKDTVMEAVCDRHPEIRRVRRVITRSAEAGGEDADAVTFEEFEARAQRGDFALFWDAHGLRYGIPASVYVDLAEGRDVLANLSRAVLPELETRFDRSMIFSITASAQVLAARLAARGRETEEEQTKRLQRADFRLAEGLNPVVIRNDGTLGEAVAAFSAALQPERA
ncbi:phosphonate metabolism protein/1,5-bisphosphokinase (PRPP-forming) PhnN [Thalassovita sp.]|uniref:phosphonate metabolism protein/1,5-bisphosphokinase (PRPP-forming) PhnN n=1 Tax=Thalassovita sp. TaxID=1979401 RepID=UPI002B26FD5B|nr:phosphonate metabolism protein/1,5-bisphosphokinase (PRPP-forming) PhnN [Thalassovita sp.]